jgi:hypothetical protein
MSNDPFKIKFNGRKIRIINMKSNDIIDKFTLYKFGNNYHQSLAIGDKVGDHSNRTYFRILSSWWNCES